MTTSANRHARIDSPRTAAVIGAGQTGVTTALGLLDAGFDVTLYSDRGQEALRNAVPATGTALIFGEAQDAESTLGMDIYHDRAPLHTGLGVRVGGPDGAEVLEFDGVFDGYYGAAVDTRLKADERLTAFLERGGRFIVDHVAPEGLDAIAGAHELILVATGRNGLSSLFPIDEARSVYTEPQRALLTVTVTGLPTDGSAFTHRGAAGGRHSYFSILPEHGEFWSGAYLHKDIGPCWAFLGWARPGSEWTTRFAAANSAESALAIVRDIYREFIDWDLGEVMAARVIEDDPQSWLKGAVHQVFREGVGFTASGYAVAALGDAGAAFDPIAGQGAQAGLIQAQRLVSAAASHDGPFGPDWISEQHESFLRARALAAARVTRLFLGDPEFGHIADQLFPAAAVDPAVAAAVVGLLHRPQPLLDIENAFDAQRFVAESSGREASSVLNQFVPAGRFSRSTFGSTTG